MPAQKTQIPFSDAYSVQEYQTVARGFIPQQMEDKWFVFLENDTLYCHRSWTGICIFEVHFVKQANGYAVAECWVNRDPDQYAGADEEEDVNIVGFLIDRVLLGKPGRLRIRAASDEQAALRMWSLLGDARSNDEPVPQTFTVIEPGSPLPSEVPQDRQHVLKASDIADLRTAAPDYQKTEELKATFRQLRGQRNPFYLSREELDPVLHWKLGSQYGRVRRWLEQNSDERYRTVTHLAFSVTLDDKALELELRTNVLTTLDGVGVPVASAILALVDPENYCVVDFRGWRAVFGKDRRAFDVGHYKKYLDEVRELAAELSWTPQETDLAIWVYDYRAIRKPKAETTESPPETQQANEDA
jgi:hypothetical protein